MIPTLNRMVVRTRNIGNLTFNSRTVHIVTIDREDITLFLVLIFVWKILYWAKRPKLKSAKVSILWKIAVRKCWHNDEEKCARACARSLLLVSVGRSAIGITDCSSVSHCVFTIRIKCTWIFCAFREKWKHRLWHSIACCFTRHSWPSSSSQVHGETIANLSHFSLLLFPSVAHPL